MERRRLGRSELEVSVICLGSMTWGDQNSHADAHAQLDYAFERGVNFIDTAEMYPTPARAETQGATDRAIGSWLKARGRRDDVILGTKVVGRSDATYYRADGRAPRLDRANIEEALNAGLKRLQTDYVDLYQLHWPDRPMTLFKGLNYDHQPSDDDIAPEETLEALDAVVKAGKARYVGLSNETPWGVMRFLAAHERGVGPRVQSIQNAYNLVNRIYETGLSEIGQREGVGLLAYSPLGQGYLSGKYRGGARPPGARNTLYPGRLRRYETPQAAAAYERYFDLAAAHGLTPAAMALAFTLTRPFLTSTIIGATDLDQLAQNIAAADAPLDQAVIDGVEAIHLDQPSPCP